VAVGSHVAIHLVTTGVAHRLRFGDLALIFALADR
jgi:hypothetical protein